MIDARCPSFAVFLLLIKFAFSRTIINGLAESNSAVTLAGVQFNEVELYQLNYDSTLSTMDYVLFEVTISDADMQTIINTSTIYPFICYAYDSDPTISFNSTTNNLSPCANGFNYNQYSRANGKYSIDISTTQTYSSIVLGVYIQGQLVSYSVKARGKFSSSNTQICPFDCNQTGQINCLSRKCICPTGKIDYDCSTDAIPITSNASVQLNLSRSKLVYAYYIPTDSIQSLSTASTVKLSFQLIRQAPEAQLYISTWSLSPLKIVPTQSDYFKQFDIIKTEQFITILPDILYNSNLSPAYVIFGMIISPNSTSTNDNSVTISLKNISGGSSQFGFSDIFIYIIIGVVLFLFLIWVIVTVSKIYFAGRNQVHSLEQMQLQLAADPNRVSIRAIQKNKLTLEIIDQFMPVILFSVLAEQYQEKGKTVSDSCAVCLGEFEQTEECREAVCGHIFHRDCLEQWLKKQENCPFCRADLSTDTLKKSEDSPENQQAGDDQLINTTLEQQNNSQFIGPTEGVIATSTTPIAAGLSTINEPLNGHQNTNSVQMSINVNPQQSHQRLRRIRHPLEGRYVHVNRSQTVQPLKRKAGEEDQQQLQLQRSFVEDLSVSVIHDQSEMNISQANPLRESEDQFQKTHVQDISGL